MRFCLGSLVIFSLIFVITMFITIFACFINECHNDIFISITIISILSLLSVIFISLYLNFCKKDIHESTNI